MAEIHNYPIAIMASGSGTTAEFFCHSIAAYHLPMEVRAIITDRPGAKVLQVIEGIKATYGWDIRTETIDRDTYPKSPGEKTWDLTDEQSEKMAELFRNESIGYVSLQGFLSRIRGSLFEEYGSLDSHTDPRQASMFNTHPGLLWLTRGLYGENVHKKTKESGTDHTAQTLHVVSKDYDEGTIIKENRVAILPTYTWEDIEKAVQASEKVHLAPDTIDFIKAREAYLNGPS